MLYSVITYNPSQKGGRSSIDMAPNLTLFQAKKLIGSLPKYYRWVLSEGEPLIADSLYLTQLRSPTGRIIRSGKLHGQPITQREQPWAWVVFK